MTIFVSVPCFTRSRLTTRCLWHGGFDSSVKLHQFSSSWFWKICFEIELASESSSRFYFLWSGCEILLLTYSICLSKLTKNYAEHSYTSRLISCLNWVKKAPRKSTASKFWPHNKQKLWYFTPPSQSAGPIYVPVESNESQQRKLFRIF